MWLRARLGWLQEWQRYCFPPSPSVTALPSLTHSIGTGTLLPSFLLKLPNTNGAASQDQHLVAGEAPVLPAPRSAPRSAPRQNAAASALGAAPYPIICLDWPELCFFFIALKREKKNTENQRVRKGKDCAGIAKQRT